MTDPNDYVAAQIGQQADDVRAAEPGQDIAEAVHAGAGLGVTSVDVEALSSAIAAMQARIDELEAGKAAETAVPLAETVKTINYFLVGHGDQRASELGADLAAAVDAAQQSGDTSRVAQVAEKLHRRLVKNPPYPGENYHWTNAVAFASDLPELIDGFKPVPAAPPGKVVAGSVIG